MRVDGDGSGQATATLAGVDDLVVAPLDDAQADSPLAAARPAASEVVQLSAAALQRRIGAPRTSARRVATAPGVAAGPVLSPGVAAARERAWQSRRIPPTPAPVVADEPPAKPSRVRDPHHYEFTGTVSVTVGPFGDLDAIAELAEAITSVPGVGSVRIRTFDGASVVFDVDLAEPTALIARLRGRSPQVLRLLYANERIIRLKIV